MVRALPFRSSSRPDFARVLAIATAIAVHVLAMMLLLMPLAGPQQEKTALPEPERWVVPQEPVVPPPPPELVQPQRPQPPQPVVTQRVQPREIPQPPIIVAQGQERAIDIPASQSEGTVGEDAVPDLSPMMMGAQLRYAKAPAPPYPRDAARAGIQGTVMLKILVDTDGTPLEVSIEKSSGNKSLDREARQHVLKHWRFEPAVRDGRPVQAYGLVPIAFSLQ